MDPTIPISNSHENSRSDPPRQKTTRQIADELAAQIRAKIWKARKLDFNPEDAGIAPEASEIFGQDWRPISPTPVEPYMRPESEWSLAGEIAERECARLLVNTCFDPPIDEEEIEAYAEYFGISKRQAELEIRKARFED
jgi:hypothetical protein